MMTVNQFWSAKQVQIADRAEVVEAERAVVPNVDMMTVNQLLSAIQVQIADRAGVVEAEREAVPNVDKTTIFLFRGIQSELKSAIPTMKRDPRWNGFGRKRINRSDC
jgi:hypothetical protein